ncbi:hypothetical protein BDF20DRAFT_910713 [Mycotypha africana]|uniref:uncharacterized protein n=1 Tax=Mycotypha africana TaxID=64632 RepID=UPI0023014E18|nr:uncharacterized protein BDF20DRAFT_910713 [Mycotypha africana]KAI8988190.1 hypothetical protein BDF20DRAFT_910713 [Mycotypha africana]
MALRREHIQQILTFKGENDHEQLVHTTQNAGRLEEYFRDLLNKLRTTKTPKENAEQYPDEASLLTLAATHRFIACNTLLGRLIIDCILEYSKLDLDPSTYNPNLDKTIVWPIVRLRRFTSFEEATKKRSDCPTLIKNISMAIEQKQNDLNDSTINRLLEMCVGLLSEKHAFALIEKLLGLALKNFDTEADEIHFDVPRAVIPMQFMEHFLKLLNGVDSNIYREWFYKTDYDLRMKLFACHNLFFETEMLQFIEEFLQQQQDSYTSIKTLYKYIKEQRLIHSIRTSTRLVNLFIQKVAAYALLFNDWRILRMMQCIALYFVEKLPEVFQRIISFKCGDMEILQHNIQCKIVDFVYAGHNADIATKRQIAWCLAMSSPCFTWHNIKELVQWCETSSPWSTKVFLSLEVKII